MPFNSNNLVFCVIEDHIYIVILIELARTLSMSYSETIYQYE